jgi:hypothetical protein
LETIIFLVAIGFAAYKFFKFNTALGAETVRAYVFMGGLRANVTVEEANFVASHDVASGPKDIILGAKQHVHRYYGGKQAPLIREAFACGMISHLPPWYQSVMGFDTFRHMQARLQRPSQEEPSN